MDQIVREQIEAQARAKILWGEDPQSVVIYLISQGIHRDEVWGIIQQMQQERAAEIRGVAVKKMIVGAAICLVPIGGFIAFRVGVLSVLLFAVTIAIGVFGVWKLVGGLLNLIFPESEGGDVADDSQI